jgi:hypothetical protein
MLFLWLEQRPNPNPNPTQVCSPPDGAVDLAAPVHQAAALFQRLFPGEAFFPAPPPVEAEAEEDEVGAELARIVDTLPARSEA